jgi:hypothetical protein
MNKNITGLYHLPLALLVAASLVACGGGGGGGSSGGGDNGGGGGGGGGGGNSSGFTLRLTDAPFDHAVRVDLVFTGVSVRQASGGWIDIPSRELKTRLVGLASLQGTKSLELVSGYQLPPGDYTELRLLVDESQSWIETVNGGDYTGGGVYPLEIPTGANPGLMVKENFTISENQPTDMVVDFDLRRSIKLTGSPRNPTYRMAPILRAAFRTNWGHIRGRVDPMLLTAGTCSDQYPDTFNAAYIFEGHNVRPVDISARPNDPDPITTTRLVPVDDNTSYIYEAGFLPAGDYTVALTCNADKEDLQKPDDDLRFFGVRNVTVRVNDIFFL